MISMMEVPDREPDFYCENSNTRYWFDFTSSGQMGWTALDPSELKTSSYPRFIPLYVDDCGIYTKDSDIFDSVLEERITYEEDYIQKEYEKWKLNKIIEGALLT